MPGKIFITGASSGLGLSHAVYLASKGYTVIGTSRDPKNTDIDKLREIFLRDNSKYRFTGPEKRKVSEDRIIAEKALVQDFPVYLKKIQYVTMDVTDENSVRNAVERIESAGPIDVLINNAGYVYWGPVEEVSIEEAKKLFEVDYFGQLRVIKSGPSSHEIPQGRPDHKYDLAGCDSRIAVLFPLFRCQIGC